MINLLHWCARFSEKQEKKEKKQTPETEGGSASHFKVMDSALQCTETNLEYKQGTSKGFGIKKFGKRLKYFVENFPCRSMFSVWYPEMLRF